MFRILLGLAVWTTLSAQHAASGTEPSVLTARVSSGGVQGTISFTQSHRHSIKSPLTLTFNLQGQSAHKVKAWRLHTFHVQYDVLDRCSPDQLGDRVLPDVGGPAVSGPLTLTTDLRLFGEDGIEGRSIVLLDVDHQTLSCATLEAPAGYVTARAVFRDGILGSLLFRQARSGIGDDFATKSLTRVTSDLSFEDGSRTVRDDEGLKWWLVNSTSCSSVRQMALSCHSKELVDCFTGQDLSERLTLVTIASGKGEGRTTFLDPDLNIVGPRNILGKTLIQFRPGDKEPRACAIVEKFVTREGVATLDTDGVRGQVTFKQESPFDPTLTSLELNNLRGLAGGYHVHQWPVPQRMLADQDVCGSDAVGGHFDPFHVESNSESPAAGAGTEDQYQVGDLSGKYGLLSSPPLNGIHETSYWDWNLPLFGRHSILGRSIIIHKAAPNSPRWVCANILDTATLTSALATFAYPIIGHVLFRQKLGDPDSDTTVYVELNYADGTVLETADHAWFVGDGAVTDDALDPDVTTRCASAGDVINPSNVSVSIENDYSGCSTGNQLQCMMGDLNGKHGKLLVRHKGTFAKAFFTDVNLKLQGDNSIIGKSLVVMSPSGATTRLACSVIEKVWPGHAVAKMGPTSPSLSVIFQQATGVIHTPTSVLLPSEASNFQIEHQPTLYTTKCNNDIYDDSVFNPYHTNVTNALTSDQFPVGALWDKTGKIMVADSTFVFNDTTLDLFGMRSVIMRSFWLPSSASGSGCADIVRSEVSGGTWVQASASFPPPVAGIIILQQYVFPDGSLSDTTVIVDLRLTSAQQTTGHKWRTHERRVGHDDVQDTGRCVRAGAIYNPFRVDTTDYAECGPANPLRCQLGDQSAKLGSYDMKRGPVVFTDVSLPLIGPFSVIGRSMVVQDVGEEGEGGGDGLSCADILPYRNPHFVDFSLSTNGQTPLDVQAIQSVVSKALDTEPHNVAVQIMSQRTHCVTVRLHLLGLQAQRLKSQFTEFLGSNSMLPGLHLSECSTDFLWDFKAY